ncbi:hypothetical protein Q1695_012767 [Nippostrongylus brasiliensis]|nr:hypothetical protein Q1695_012767 [Nippostrongylus brasiliensis]
MPKAVATVLLALILPAVSIMEFPLDPVKGWTQELKCKAARVNVQIPYFERYHKDMGMQLKCEYIKYARIAVTQWMTGRPQSIDKSWCKHSKTMKERSRTSSWLANLMKRMSKRVIRKLARTPYGRDRQYGCYADRSYNHKDRAYSLYVMCLYKKGDRETCPK